jgi:aconitate hydratase
MGDSLAKKILKSHLVEGSLKKGEEIAIKIDQTLTQDATGTMAYLQLELSYPYLMLIITLYKLIL